MIPASAVLSGVLLYSAFLVWACLIYSRWPVNWFFIFFFFLMIRPPPRSTLFPYPPLFRSVADQEPRGARLPDPRDQVREAGDLLLRESGPRLVEQQHRGPPCEGAGELDEPLVAERQIPPELVRVAPVADEREEPARLLAEPRLPRAHLAKADDRGGQRARAAARETDHHGLEDGHRLEEVRGLKRPADPRARDPVGRQPRE